MFIIGKKKLSFALLIQLVAILLFMKALWPLKKQLSGFALLEELPAEPCNEPCPLLKKGEELYVPRISRLVLMVIDALRFDFVHQDDNFPYLGSLLRDRRALLLKARAHLPTVTLPRIKTITSGGVPAYTDVVTNFKSGAFAEDNLVDQAHRNGRKVVFYGDESWLGLFPHQFARYEGTTSFFVNDFYEVDDNVTRHLSKELRDLDWDVLILHYLGLDHIGHARGPFSDLVGPKLNEMDSVVETVFAALERTRDSNLSSLLVVTGDHGMSDHGGHGGSSDSETLVPFVFALTGNSRFEQESLTNVVPQSSLTPTLSSLLGLPIPVNNLGTILPQLFTDIDQRQQMYLWYANAHQMIRLTSVSTDDFNNEYSKYQTAVRLHAEWVASGDFKAEDSSKQIIDLYREVTETINVKLMASIVNQDFYLMIVATILLWQNIHV